MPVSGVGVGGRSKLLWTESEVLGELKMEVIDK